MWETVESESHARYWVRRRRRRGWRGSLRNNPKCPIPDTGRGGLELMKFDATISRPKILISLFDKRRIIQKLNVLFLLRLRFLSPLLSSFLLQFFLWYTVGTYFSPPVIEFLSWGVGPRRLDFPFLLLLPSSSSSSPKTCFIRESAFGIPHVRQIFRGPSTAV